MFLVIQGAGMNMRGYSQIDLFGSMTLDEINKQILAYSKSLSMDINIVHSNVEGEVINFLYNGHHSGILGALINPAGYTTSTGPLSAAITQVGYPVIEVHFTNPTSRGVISNIHPVCNGSVYGFGVFSYYLGLQALKHLSES